VRGLVALLLVKALLAASGAGPSLHTHAYSGHDHPEHHHHGLAAHQHVTAAPHVHESASRVQDCSPAAHTIEFALISIAPSQAHNLDAALTEGPMLAAEPCAGGWVRGVDLRVHGPPPRADSSPRAPPPVALT
jgi:hypothetical protein